MTGSEQDALVDLNRYIQLAPLPIMLGIVMLGLGLYLAIGIAWGSLRRREVGTARKLLRGTGLAALVLFGLVCLNGFPVPGEACRIAASNPGILSEVKVSGRMRYSVQRARDVCRSGGIPIGEVRS